MVKAANQRRRSLSCRLSLRALVANRSAVSAVEFALILPVMLSLYLGGIQISQALSINRKVAHVTSTLGDLVAQSKSLTGTDVQSIFDASSSVMAPYASTPLEVTVTEIAIDGAGKATVAWSDARNATALTAGSSVTLPVALLQANTWVVAAVAHYPYTPTIGYVITGSFDLHSTYYLSPRLSKCISRSPYTCT